MCKRSFVARKILYPLDFRRGGPDDTEDLPRYLFDCSTPSLYRNWAWRKRSPSESKSSEPVLAFFKTEQGESWHVPKLQQLNCVCASSPSRPIACMYRAGIWSGKQKRGGQKRKRDEERIKDNKNDNFLNLYLIMGDRHRPCAHRHHTRRCLTGPHPQIPPFNWSPVEKLPGTLTNVAGDYPRSRQNSVAAKDHLSLEVKEEGHEEANLLGFALTVSCPELDFCHWKFNQDLLAGLIYVIILFVPLGCDQTWARAKEAYQLGRHDQIDIQEISLERAKGMCFWSSEVEEIYRSPEGLETQQENYQWMSTEHAILLGESKNDSCKGTFQDRHEVIKVDSGCGKHFCQSFGHPKNQKMQKGEKLHACTYCGKIANRRADLIVHERTHTGEKPYECSECGKSFNTTSYLTKHKRIHTGEKPYKCLECGQSFCQKGNLVSHVRIHTGEKPYQCVECGQCFSQRKILEKHQRIHTGEKPYKCLECGQRFSQTSHLLTHRRTHTGERPHKCSDCEKSFNQKGDLVIHRRKHTGQKPYECSECGKSFSTSYQFINHKRLHTGEKPYTCSDCGQSFNWKSNLITHQRIHTGEKPYECPSCRKSFSDKSSLTKHLRTHTGEKPYKCSDCGQSFNLKSNLITHQRTHTGEKPYSCPQCGKSLSHRSSLTKHMRTHTGEKPYECCECGKGFISSSDCRKHERVHAREKPYKRGRKCPLIPLFS
ncbi:Zinc finger and SCAN domain-containing protein 2 [Varanus komodoensis]|nr:Zinc finger and SCAN domain-containing protein 2 [Varanus komodoensis]